jgi:hypothetical protein
MHSAVDPWNAYLYEDIFTSLGDETTKGNVFDHLRSLSEIRCSILGEIEFISSAFHELFDRCSANTMCNPVGGQRQRLEASEIVGCRNVG